MNEDRVGDINLEFFRLCKILTIHGLRLKRGDYGKISISNDGELKHHLANVRANMVKYLSKSGNNGKLKVISDFIQIMLLLVERYELEYGETQVVMKIENIPQEIPPQFQKKVKDAWPLAA